MIRELSSETNRIVSLSRHFAALSTSINVKRDEYGILRAASKVSRSLSYPSFIISRKLCQSKCHERFLLSLCIPLMLGSTSCSICRHLDTATCTLLNSLDDTFISLFRRKIGVSLISFVCCTIRYTFPTQDSFRRAFYH